MDGYKGDKPLYEDDKLKIGYLENSPEDHVLYIKTESEELQFIIQRHILRSLAKAEGGDLVRIIQTISPTLFSIAERQGIGPKEIHDAIRKAYATEEENRQKWFKEQGLEF